MALFVFITSYIKSIILVKRVNIVFFDMIEKGIIIEPFAFLLTKLELYLHIIISI